MTAQITPRVTPQQAQELAEGMCRNLGIEPHGFAGRDEYGDRIDNWETFRSFATTYLAADLALQDMLGLADSAGPRDAQEGK